MSSVDERIVEMRFDSKQFESGAKSAINILDSLEKALQLEGVSRGITNVKAHVKTLEGAAKGVGLMTDIMNKGADSSDNLSQSLSSINTSQLSNGLAAITSKFSVLGTMADQVLRRITDGLMDAAAAAAHMASNLVIKPISSGFAQYEQETKSVQTLMNATGLGMAEIEAYTEKLGFYVDETSYSYESMFSTLANMMSSGVEDIDVGVDALIGLGNAAGLAGVDAAQATHAFEGFGKAIGQGYMDSRNWSWIKTARMDTTALKQAFIDAGVAAGTLTQKVDKKTGETLTYVADAAGNAREKLGAITAANMDNFLGEKWLTRDAMLSGVGNYSTAFNQIYADYLETGDYAEDIIDRLGDSLDAYSLKAFRAANQTRTFTDVMDYISGAAARRWSTAFKKIFGNFEESSALWASLIDPMYDIFITPLDNMNELLDGWRDLGGYEHVVDGITAAFEGFVNIATSVREAFHDIFPEVTAERLFSFTKGVKNLAERFRDFTSGKEIIDFVGQFDEKMDKFVRNSKGLDQHPIFQKNTWGYLMDGLKGVMSGFSLAGKTLKAFWTALKPTRDLLSNFGKNAIIAFGKLGEKLTELNKSLESSDIFPKLREGLENFQTTAIEALGKLPKLFKNFGTTLKNVGKTIKDFAGDKLKTLSDNLRNVIQNFDLKQGLTLGAMVSALFAGFNIKRALEIFSYVKKALINFKDFIWDFMGTIEDAFYATGIDQSAGALMKVAGALAIVAGSLIALSFINPDALGSAFAVLSAMFGELIGAMEIFRAMTKADYAGVLRIGLLTTSLLKISASLLIMAGALKMIGSIPVENMWSSVGALTVMFGELVGAMMILSNPKFVKTLTGGKMKNLGKAMVEIAESLLIMSAALKLLSTIEDSNTLGAALFSIVVMLGAMTAAMVVLSQQAGKAMVGAGAMLGMATSILILTAAVKVIAGIGDAGALDTALQSVVGLMVVMTTLTALLGNFGGGAGNMLGAGASMMLMATSLIIVAGALKVISGIGNQTGSVLTVAATLMALAVALNMMSGTLGGAAAMLVASVAIAVLSGALILLGANIGAAVDGLFVLIGALIAFTLAGALATAVIGPLLALSAAILMMGAGMLAAGVGMMAFGAGFAAIAASAAAGAAAIVAAIRIIITGVGEIASDLVGAIAAIIVAVANAIVASIGAIANAIGALILGVLSALAQYTPQIASAGIQLVTGLINAVASQIGPLVTAGIVLIISFVNGMAEAIETHGNELLSAFGNLMAAIIGFVGEALARLVSLIPGVGDKMAAAVRAGTEAIKGELTGSDLAEAGAEAAGSIVEGAASATGNMGETGTQLGMEMVSGVESTEGDAESAGEDLSMEAINGLLANLAEGNSAGASLGDSATDGFDATDFFSVGSFGGQGLIDGLISKIADARAAGASLGSAASEGAAGALEVESPSKVFKRIGRFAGEGLCIGMNQMLSDVSNTAEDMGYTAIDSITDSMKLMSEFMASDMNARPVITPVLDLSAVKDGRNAINTYLGGSIGVGIRGSIKPNANESANIAELITIGRAIISEIQNGSDLYFDDGAFAGRINRRLGIKI